MTNIVFKPRRGSSAAHATFVGALHELTLDTTLYTLRLHDAVTPGGIILARVSDVEKAPLIENFAANEYPFADGGSPGSWIASPRPPFAGVRVATWANVTIDTALAPGATIDGKTLAVGDVVGVFGQTAPAENGIYVVGGSPVARHPAFQTYDIFAGLVVSIEEGTLYGGRSAHCTSARGGTLDTTSLVFIHDWVAKMRPGDIRLSFDESEETGMNDLDGTLFSGGAALYPHIADRYPWMVTTGSPDDDLQIPDARGYFFRNWDNGAGLDPNAGNRTARVGDGQGGDYPGTTQTDALEDHRHALDPVANRGGGGGSYTNNSSGQGNWNTGDIVNGTANHTGNETRSANIGVNAQMRMG